tara:strand:- start:5928 stop:6041 length:114 start_codon:yes stop_codon:yes gene_type:complete
LEKKDGHLLFSPIIENTNKILKDILPSRITEVKEGNE